MPYRVDAEEVARALTVLCERSEGASWADVARRGGIDGRPVDRTRVRQVSRQWEARLFSDPRPAERMLVVLRAITRRFDVSA